MLFKRSLDYTFRLIFMSFQLFAAYSLSLLRTEVHLHTSNLQMLLNRAFRNEFAVPLL